MSHSRPHGSIFTKRLRISPWSRDDAEDFYLLSQDPGFTAFPITRYDQASLDSALQWIDREIELFQSTGLGKLAVRENESSELIGMCGLTPWEWEGERLVDLTYRFRQQSWGKGYGREAATALLSRAFDVLGLGEVTATITPDNHPSIRLATLLGFKFEREIVLKNADTRLFRLRSEDFFRS